MFRGISSVNFDTKGRFVMPVRYRELIGVQIVATIDTEATCLLLYPVAQWETIEQKLQTLPSFNAAARRIQRLLIGHATDLQVDENGRILLPKILRDYAKLDKQAVLVGQGSKLEIWDESLWHSSREGWINQSQQNGSDDLPEELQQLSL